VRLAVRADRHAAFVHAAELWRAERWLHLDVEPSLNHLASANHFLLDAAGGLAVLGLGLLGTAGKQRRPCDGHQGAGARQGPAAGADRR
jgi:hypothetical protein